MTPVNSLTQTPPVWCKIVDYISYVIRVMDNYMLKFPNFRCHGNKGPSEIYFNDTVKLPDLVQESGLSYVSWDIAIFLPKFGCAENGGSEIGVPEKAGPIIPKVRRWKMEDQKMEDRNTQDQLLEWKMQDQNLIITRSRTRTTTRNC